jgi:hypothetical protein
MAYLRLCASTDVDELRKAANNFIQKIRHKGRYLNPGTPKQEATVQATRPRCSMVHFWVIPRHL